jgi:hypothetical protein
MGGRRLTWAHGRTGIERRLRITDMSTTFHKEITCSIKPTSQPSPRRATPPAASGYCPVRLGRRRLSALPGRRSPHRRRTTVQGAAAPRRCTARPRVFSDRAGSHVETSHVTPQDTAFSCNFVTSFFADQFCHDS